MTTIEPSVLIEIIFNSITALLGFYLVFFKSYFTEKGKNLATVQDVNEITTLVEDAKKGFNEDLEFLKNRLSLLNENFTNVKTLERNALIEINTKYSDWLHSLSTFELAYYSYDNYESLKSIDLFFNEKQLSFNIAVDQLHLFTHDYEIINKTTQLTLLTLELHKSILLNIIKYILNCANYNDKRKQANESEQLQLNTNYHKSQEPVFEAFLKEKKKILQQIMNPHIDFIKILHSKVYSLIDEV